MRLKSIITDRQHKSWPSWHIVYEWEDELSKLLELPLKNSPFGSKNIIFKIIKRIDKKFFNGNIFHAIYHLLETNTGYSIYFEMNPLYYKNFSNSKKTIPIIIDFWDKDNISKFKLYYANCPYILVTSKEVYDFLKENGAHPKLFHFPMSLPTIYKLNPNETFQKKYDIILAGRKNPVLWEYLKKFELVNPNIEYLYQVQKDGELYYESNKRGIIGKFHTRSAYIALLKQSKIAFYTTPGIDGGERRTNGFNPVTPRIFELLCSGCWIIARYPKSAETDFYNLNEVCHSTDTYIDFENQ